MESNRTLQEDQTTVTGTLATLLEHAAFYYSAEQPCPYLPARTERKLFTRLPDDPRQATTLNGALTQAGFRRSHDVVYRPACVACQACVPTRVVVREFTPSRSQARSWRRNQALRFLPETELTDEYYDLFRRYQLARHEASDMVQMSATEFADMVTDGSAALELLALRDTSGRLQGALLADALPDGFSAIYSFYEPEPAHRGLGTLLVLRLIDLAAQRDLPYVYLGYWIAESRKMRYKALFQPQEQMTATGWQAVALPA